MTNIKVNQLPDVVIIFHKPGCDITTGYLIDYYIDIPRLNDGPGQTYSSCQAIELNGFHPFVLLLTREVTKKKPYLRHNFLYEPQKHQTTVPLVSPQFMSDVMVKLLLDLKQENPRG